MEDISLQLVSGGRRLADKLGENVSAVVVGSNNGELANELASYGIDEVFFLNSPQLSSYSVKTYVGTLSKFLVIRTT